MISAIQEYDYVIWKNCPHWFPDRNRRFRLGRISSATITMPPPVTSNGELWEVFDADNRTWGRVSGNYVIARPAKLNEIMGAQA